MPADLILSNDGIQFANGSVQGVAAQANFTITRVA